MDNRRFVANLLEVSPNSLKELPDYAIAKIADLHSKATSPYRPDSWAISNPLEALGSIDGQPIKRGPVVGTRFLYDLTVPVPCRVFRLLRPIELVITELATLTVPLAFTHPAHTLASLMLDYGVIVPAQFGASKAALIRSMRAVDVIRLFTAWLIYQKVPVAFFPYIADIPAMGKFVLKSRKEVVKQVVRSVVAFYAPKIRRDKSIDGTDSITYLYALPINVMLGLVNELCTRFQNGRTAYNVFVESGIANNCDPIARYAPLWDGRTRAEDKFHLTMVAAQEFGLHFNTQLHIRDVQPTSIHAEELVASLNTKEKFIAMLDEFEANSI